MVTDDHMLSKIEGVLIRRKCVGPLRLAAEGE